MLTLKEFAVCEKAANRWPQGTETDFWFDAPELHCKYLKEPPSKRVALSHG